MKGHRTMPADVRLVAQTSRTSTATRRAFMFVLLGVLVLSSVAAAQDSRRPSAEWSVIRQGAPNVQLPPTTRVLDEGRFVSENLSNSTPIVYENVVLRGAIGHVPRGEGTCTIDDGRVKTSVTYAKGLPMRSMRVHGDVHRDVRTLHWDAKHVQLQKIQRETQVRGPASSRDTDDWNTQNWSIETFGWDDYRRPESFERSQAGGEYDAFECSWQTLSNGVCTYRRNLQAVVKLTYRGEVQDVTWKTRGSSTLERSLSATWDGDRLMRVLRKGTPGSVNERFHYNTDGELEGFERRTRVSRGKQTLRWTLTRDANRNVVRVERACTGACAGMKRVKTFEIDYDDTMNHTFCGAWWDDGIDPTIRGW